MMTIDDRLRQGTVVIMDGGTGTEIQRRGNAMDSEVWSGLAHMQHPETTRTVHADYIRAGAEIVIANTFSTALHVLAARGVAEQFEEINRRAVELAIEARDDAAQDDVWIAGSISSMVPLTAAGFAATGAPRVEALRRQAEVLAAAGADLIIAEMMEDRAGALRVTQAAQDVGIPLWVGFSATSTDDGRIIGTQPTGQGEVAEVEDFGELVDTVLATDPQVAGVMHTSVEDTGPALAILQQRWNGPTTAYAETGRFAPPTWLFEETTSPDGYAEAMTGWVAEHGVQIVGGCCGTGPDHIRALHERLAGMPLSG